MSDRLCCGTPVFPGKSLAVTVPDVPKATAIFEALAAEGQVQMLRGKTFWSPILGSLIDTFGVS